jgi:hypothetical protein
MTNVYKGFFNFVTNLLTWDIRIICIILYSIMIILLTFPLELQTDMLKSDAMCALPSLSL